MAKRVTHKTVGDAVIAKEPFVGPSSRGGDISQLGTNKGMLPENYSKMMDEHEPSYVVKSYSTPIAWHGKEGWVVPDVKYSSTTSRLQNTIRRSINQHFQDGHDGARS